MRKRSSEEKPKSRNIAAGSEPTDGETDGKWNESPPKKNGRKLKKRTKKEGLGRGETLARREPHKKRIAVRNRRNRKHFLFPTLRRRKN